MAAHMGNMFRVLVKLEKRNFSEIMQPQSLPVCTIIWCRRRMATVTNYRTTGDDVISELKSFRKHPGIMRPKQVRLPEMLKDNINKYLADKPLKKLEPHAKSLANYLWSRSRPLEESSLRVKAQEYAVMQGVEDIDEDMVQSPDLPKDSKKKLATIMQNLRKHVYHWQPVVYDETTVCTYIMSRIAPNYATTYRVLQEIQKRVPDFTPQAVLDFGSGVGTTAWAAHTLWGDSIQEYYCVDTSRPMHDTAEMLMKDVTADEDTWIETSPLKRVYFRHFMPMSLQKTYDLTISAHSLLELPCKADRLSTLRTLWYKTEHFLILIESGTNEGFRTLLEARDYILNGAEKEEENKRTRGRRTARGVARDVAREDLGLAKGPATVSGHVFAPCQHDLPCPRLADGSSTPCNFEQDFHDYTKRGHASELTTERFSYLVLRKGARNPGDKDCHWPRLVRPVLPRSRHVVCRLCCSNGQIQEAVITRTKHGRDLYRCSRSSKWGDLLPISRPSDDGVSEEDTDSVEDSGISSD